MQMKKRTAINDQWRAHWRKYDILLLLVGGNCSIIDTENMIWKERMKAKWNILKKMKKYSLI